MSVCVYFHILCIGYISKTPDLPKRQDLALVPELSFPFRCLKFSFCPCWHSWLSIFRVRKDGFADDAFAFAEQYVDFFQAKIEAEEINPTDKT